MADIPGLIEGAHEGLGLGDRFLSHVERTKVLVHVIDGTAEDVAASYAIIRHEMESFNPEFVDKPEIVVLNKCDQLEDKEIKAKSRALKKLAKTEIYPISTYSKDGMPAVIAAAFKAVSAPQEE